MSQCNAQCMPSIGTIFPTEIQKIILRHLDWQDLNHLRATNRHYRNIVTNNSDAIWKARYDARWSNSKRHSCKDLHNWSRTKGWTVHPGDIVEGDWYKEFVRRSRLDRSVLPRLMTLDLDQSVGNETWYGLMGDGQDIVDCLKTIVNRQRKKMREASVAQHIEIPPSTLQAACEKVLTGISRCVAYQEWKFLHDSTVNNCFLEKDKVQLEDGAIVLAKFYHGSDQIMASDRVHDFQEYVLEELERLAAIVLGRLHKRSRAQIDSKYPILEVLEEMKFLFHNPDEDNPAAFSGNADDYYNHTNSLINYCLNWRTGIPISLAVVYASIVRRVCGLEMDIIGLPGHIVLGVPFHAVGDASRLFVDPFHQGRLLSLADCQNIVARYNMTFNEDMVSPISNEKVWERMVRNLIHCHSMQALSDDNDNTNSNQEWKIAVPLRYFLSDYAPQMGNFQDLVSSPGWCPQYC